MCLAVLRLIWLMPTRPRLPARVCLLGPITLPSFVEDAPEQLSSWADLALSLSEQTPIFIWPTKALWQSTIVSSLSWLTDNRWMDGRIWFEYLVCIFELCVCACVRVCVLLCSVFFSSLIQWFKATIIIVLRRPGSSQNDTFIIKSEVDSMQCIYLWGVLAKHSIMVRASIRLSLFCLSSCSTPSSSTPPSSLSSTPSSSSSTPP